MHFDTTVRLSDLLIGLGMIAGFLKVWLALRDQVLDHAHQIIDLKTITKSHEQELRDHDAALLRMGWSKRLRTRALDEEST